MLLFYNFFFFVPSWKYRFMHYQSILLPIDISSGILYLLQHHIFAHMPRILVDKFSVIIFVIMIHLSIISNLKLK